MAAANLTFLLLITGVLLENHENGATLHIRLYDRADVQSSVLNRAKEVAAVLLSDTGIRVAWDTGDPHCREASLVDMTAYGRPPVEGSDSRTHLIVRLIGDAPPSFPPQALGFALPESRYGIHLTVFFHRIRQLAESCSRKPDENLTGHILGHAIVHEIGHILLGSGEHAEDGLMKARWTLRDFDRPDRLLRFDSAAAERIRSGVRSRPVR